MRLPDSGWFMVFALIGITWILLKMNLPPLVTGAGLVAMVVLLRIMARSIRGA